MNVKKSFMEQGQGDFSAAELRGVEMCVLKRRMLPASPPMDTLFTDPWSRLGNC